MLKTHLFSIKLYSILLMPEGSSTIYKIGLTTWNYLAFRIMFATIQFILKFHILLNPSIRSSDSMWAVLILYEMSYSVSESTHCSQEFLLNFSSSAWMIALNNDLPHRHWSILLMVSHFLDTIISSLLFVTCMLLFDTFLGKNSKLNLN